MPAWWQFWKRRQRRQYQQIVQLRSGVLRESADSTFAGQSAETLWTEPATLVKVIPLNRVFEVKTGRLTLVSLEAHEEASILRFRITRKEPTEPLPSNSLMFVEGVGVRFKLTDDPRTSYRLWQSGAGGGATNWEGSTRFSPGIPSIARTATIQVQEWNRADVEVVAEQNVLATVTVDL
jgi:hypothetical protein